MIANMMATTREAAAFNSDISRMLNGNNELPRKKQQKEPTPLYASAPVTANNISAEQTLKTKNRSD